MKAAPTGSTVVLRLVAGAGYTPVLGSANGNLPKFYLRDSSGNNNGLVTPTTTLACAFIAKARRRLKATAWSLRATEMGAFQEYRLEPASAYARVAQGQEYPQPDAAVVDDINDNMNNVNDARWGNLVKITGATVGSGVVEKDYWYELGLTDGTSDTPGILLVWKQAGVSLTDLQGLAGKTMDFTGIISRIQIAPSLDARPNVLEARGRDDIFGGEPQNVASVGEAKSMRDGTIVNFTVPQIVTLGEMDFFYMESADGTAGIRVESDTMYNIGDKVTVTGAALSTLPSGERVLRLTPEGPSPTPERAEPCGVDDDQPLGGRQGLRCPGWRRREFGLDNRPAGQVVAWSL